MKHINILFYKKCNEANFFKTITRFVNTNCLNVPREFGHRGQVWDVVVLAIEQHHKTVWA